MQSERDILRDVVIPRVNTFAAEYGAQVELIDLRWGVNTADVSEEEQTHKVLRTCLDEIQRSRPFFIGILGDRYGWVPPEQEMNDAVESVEYCATTLKQSVTSLEIEYGALHSPEPPVCLFYFRRIKNFMLNKHDSTIYYDKGTAQSRLKVLKEEIKKKFKNQVRRYDVRIANGEVSGLESFADMLTEDIIAVLRAEWGDAPADPPSEKEQEVAALDAFRLSRTVNFAGRTAAIQELQNFCLGDNNTPILLVQGEAGSGKSALMCRAMDEIEDKCFLLPASCGLTPRSSEPKGILRTLIWRMEKHLGLESEETSNDESLDDEHIEKKASTLDEVKERFFDLLHIASNKERVVVVIDALDQLCSSEEVQYMRWFNEKIPQNVRVLFSIIGGAQVDAIRRLGGQIYPVPTINNNDIADIIRSMAKRNHKQIADSVVDYILKKTTPDGQQAAQNPLYLSLLVQDLVMMDRYEHAVIDKYTMQGMAPMDAIIRFMKERVDQTPPDAEDVFIAVIERLGKLVGHDFVRAVCGMIAVSRSGLRESDLEGAFRKIGLNFNIADFSWLRQLLRGHFTQGDMQQWDFAHQSLRRALRKKLEALKLLNIGIADYLRDIVETDTFAKREIIHHLCVANQPYIAAQVMSVHGKKRSTAFSQRLAESFVDNENGAVFLLAIPTNLEKAENVKRWLIAEIIEDSLRFLPENTHLFRIELMLSALAMLKGWTGEQARRVTALCENTIAMLYTEIGEYGKVEEYLIKSIKVREQLYDKNKTASALGVLSKSYGNIGHLFSTKGRTEEAGRYYKKYIDAAETLYEQSKTDKCFERLHESYIFMGIHLREKGQIEEVEAYFQKALDVIEIHFKQAKSSLALSALSRSNNEIGWHLRKIGKIKEAGTYFQKAIESREKLYEQIGTTGALRNLSVMYSRMGQHLTSLGQTTEAGIYYEQFLDTQEQLYQKIGTAKALNDLTFSYMDMGDHLREIGEIGNAEKYYQKSLDAREQLYEQSGTLEALSLLSDSYSGMGIHKSKLGLEEEAGIYFQKYLSLREKLYEQSNTPNSLKKLAYSYNNVGTHKSKLGLVEEAGKYFKKSLAIFESLHEQSKTIKAQREVAMLYINLGENLTKLGQIDKARVYLNEALVVFEKLYEQNKTAEVQKFLIESYITMSEHLTAVEQIEEAGKYYQKAIDEQEQLHKQSGNATTLKKLLKIYDKMGECLTAQGKKEEAESFCQKAHNLEQIKS